jgi:hypothetical protein
MSFKFACPHCGQRIGAALEDVGTLGGCPSCQRQFVVPEAPEPEPVVVAVETEPKPEVEPITRRGMAILAMVLSIFPVINLVALGLAIYAIVRSDRPGRHGERGLAIAAVVVAGLLLIPINFAGVLAAATGAKYKPVVNVPDFAASPRSPSPAKAVSPTPAKAVKQ